MRNIVKILADLKSDHREGLVLMEPRGNDYWLGLPAYANIYIRRPYEMITDMAGLIEFCHYFLIEYSQTRDIYRRTAIYAVVFPIYRSLTGANYDSNRFAAFGLTNAKI